ncbi:MAG: erythromycin esterase family protein [Thiohalocapsa sp.]
MADSDGLIQLYAKSAAALPPLLRHHAEPLPSPDQHDEFGALFDRFADAKIVLLGEATHGTAEFYQARAAISRRLIERHGFTIVAVEADWPDAAHIDRYVRHREKAAEAAAAFQRFPTWMWRNAEVMRFLDWLRQHNAGLPAERRAAFRGLDVYSLGASIDAVIGYLDRIDPQAAAAARRRYGCLTPWQEEPAEYGRAVIYGHKHSCEDETVAQLNQLLSERLHALGDDTEAYFDATQNARIVRAAERYYRLMYRGSTESWNLRDRHMFDTLQALMRAGGDDTANGAKAIVWAHNSHIGNAAATAMGWQGEFNIGELCRTAYGDEAVLIGFGTDHGSVAAADDWGGEMQVKTVRPARPDSWEHAFRHAGIARSLTDWRRPDRAELAARLREPLLERAIGVVYRPQSEFLSHYFEAVLADQFDAFVWFEETRAITPLPAGAPNGAPDTYPFGV